MKKYILMAVIVGACYISLSYAALDSDKYEVLEFDKQVLEGKGRRLAILDTIITADVWDAFKFVYYEIEQARAQGTKKELLKNLEEEKLNQDQQDQIAPSSIERGEHNRIWSGFGGSLSYDDEYIKTELKKTERESKKDRKKDKKRHSGGDVDSSKRRCALELMQSIARGYCNQELLTMMDEAEKHGSRMSDYIREQQCQTEQSKQAIEHELSQMPKEPEMRFMGRRWTPETERKAGKKRNLETVEKEDVLAVDEGSEQKMTDLGEVVMGHTVIRKLNVVRDKRADKQAVEGERVLKFATPDCAGIRRDNAWYEDRPSNRPKPATLGYVDRVGYAMPEGGFTEDEPIIWKEVCADEKAIEQEPAQDMAAPNSVKYRFGEGYTPPQRPGGLGAH